MTDSKEQGATPRTDAMLDAAAWRDPKKWATQIGALTDFARTLERELEALQAKADGLQSGNVRLWERAEAAENKLIEDTESFSRAMLKQVDRAEAAEARAGRLAAALRNVIDHAKNCSEAGYPSRARFDAAADAYCDACDALAPFRAMPEGE